MGKVIKPGKSFRGCVLYCVQKNGATILEAEGVRMDQAAHIIADFNMQRKINPELGQAVGHIALNWSPNDQPKLNDELMVLIAKEYLQKMKIQDTQYLMVKHSDKEHPHLHIVYNRVNNEGKTISDSMQRWQNVKASKALTLKYQLHISKGKEQVNRQQLKGADQLKYELYDKIKPLITKVSSISELERQLSKQGISMLYKYKSGSREIQGISFAIGDYKFKGSEIDRSLSYGNIRQVIQQTLAERQQLKTQKLAKNKSHRQMQEPGFVQQSSTAGLLRALLEQRDVGNAPVYPELIKKKKCRKEQSQGINL